MLYKCSMQITKNADNSKNNCKGYGICFDERSEFGHTITEGGFTRLIEQIIFMLWVQALQKVFMILRYIQKITFTETLQISVKKFVLSLHYNGNNSYLFVNGRQELNFKCKTDQLVKEELCVGNLSDQWTYG